MIRSILHIGGGPGRSNDASSEANKRRMGRVVLEGVNSSWGNVVNASAGGLRVIARGAVFPKQGEASVLTIEGPNGPFRVVARVVWTRKKNWGKQEIGVQFVEVPPDSRAQLAWLAEVASRDCHIGELSDSMSRVD